ncbi:MAG TPA: acyl-CoA dehydrogenase family protein [Chloroflexota bacterium]|nr:acyl-CoA dehydrogenase family protein [Chloroflexota bacterium]
MSPDYARFDDLLSADERALRDRVRAFVTEEVLPLVPDHFERGAFPTHLIPRLAALELLEERAPVQDGLVAHELERADAGLRSFVSVHAHLAAGAVRFFGSDAQRARYLPALARGETIGAFSLTEPGHGSDPGAMDTVARPVDGGYVLDGHKRWATNGTLAGVIVVWARMVTQERPAGSAGHPGEDPGERPAGEVAAFLLEPETPGLRVAPIEGKLSFRMSASSELFLERCFVPEGQRLPGAKGLSSALRCLNEARFGIVWGTAGAAEACFEEGLRYALAREQFGRPIAGFQLTQEKLADMYAAVVQAKLLALHLGRLKERGALHYSAVSLGKRTNVRHALFVARTARTILGAHGITAEAGALRHAANLESELTYEGTDEVHALVLGRHLTGLDAFR